MDLSFKLKWVLLLAFLLLGQSAFCQEYSKKIALKMGSRFEITAIDDNNLNANKSVDAAFIEIDRIERLISSWDSTSQTSLINKLAGIKPVKVDLELFQLIKRCKKISALTDGAFDISYASMDKIWFFNTKMEALPDSAEILNSVKWVDWEAILLNDKDTTIFLANTHMKIGFGAIGKGYAANRARQLMIEMGIESGVVNAGGDLICWGGQEGKDYWEIGIANPNQKQKIFNWMQLRNEAVVTSGNYERFIIFNNKRYSHIIHPKTGWPVEGLKSVTVICKDAEFADGFATGLFVLGVKEGLTLVNQLDGVEAVFVTSDDQTLMSNGIKTGKTTQKN